MMELLAELEKLRLQHDYCDDGWYSCPLSPDGCSDDSIPKDKCNCGATEHNERLDNIIKWIKMFYQELEKDAS